jgi:hypothetical protein
VVVPGAIIAERRFLLSKEVIAIQMYSNLQGSHCGIRHVMERAEQDNKTQNNLRKNIKNRMSLQT